MKHEKQYFTLSLFAILISIVLSATEIGAHRSGMNAQYNPLYSSAEAAERINIFSSAASRIKESALFAIAEGRASYYSNQFHGRKTANGETFNTHNLTAAHPSLPFGTWVKVTNLGNGKDVIVRINDRGPFVKGRIIDLSASAAKEIGLLKSGTVQVKLEALGAGPSASISG